MKPRNIWLILILMVSMLAAAGLVFAERDDDEHEREEGHFSRWFQSDHMAVSSRENPLYQEECGSCHFAFQPGFLPAASWQKIMAGLDDHFGENAELSDDNAMRILDYLSAHSADRVKREVSRKVMWSLRSSPEPMRITETAFFRHEHREIPPRFLNNNGEKIAFSNCDSCHTQAKNGSYNEHEIRIPGIGRWDD